MDNFRLILFISGILVIAAIYAWEVLRERRANMERLNIFDDDPSEHDELEDAFYADTDARQYPDPSDRTMAVVEDETTPDDPEASGGQDAQNEPSVAPSSDARTIPMEQSSAQKGEIATESQAGDTAALKPADTEPPPESPVLPAEKTRAEKSRLERVRARNNQEKGRAGKNALEKSGDAKGLVLALTIMARPGRRFMGPDIRGQFENVGMRFGEMRIFHHFGMDGQRTEQPIFSAADILEPGVFPAGNLENHATRGLILFMQLPGPLDGLIAFELMLNVAQKVAKSLDGELCDDTRSTLTTQAANHLRERIEEMKRKQLV